MSFGIKNVEATYQRLVDTEFQSQIGTNLEAFVDDVVIKSKIEMNMLVDITETFKEVRRINMKLNPMKCSFGVEEGKFMGYMVTSEGTKDAENAFQEMKKIIMELPSLTTPKVKEPLYIYLEASNKAISTVLLADRKGKQCPVHYVSRTLHERENNYALIEKVALSLFLISRRLRKLTKWAIELGTYDIMYEPWSAIKGHVLMDFLTETPTRNVEKRTRFKEAKNGLNDTSNSNDRTLFTASNLKGVGVGLVLISLDGTEYTYDLRLYISIYNGYNVHMHHIT
ncbi:reverse transcriptase domain-containing protein [Tanacetum coccineum]